MLTDYRKIISLFTPGERRRFAMMLAAVTVMGIIQVAGVGSIIPFVSLLVDRSVIHENQYIAWAYDYLGFSSVDGFLFFAGAVVIFILVVGNTFTAFTIWLMARFVWSSQVRISTRLMQQYLNRPYSFFLNRNSSDIGKNILFESTQLTQGVLMPAMNILAFGVAALLIASFLLWLNPLLTLLAAAVFAASYGVIYFFIRRPLDRLGRRRMAVNGERFKSVTESFGSIKELKVLGRQSSFVGWYTSTARTFAGTLVVHQVLGALPRYIIETVAFSLLMGVFLYLLYVGADLQGVVPLASAFAFASYRLLPIMQRIFSSANSLRFNASVLDALHKDLTEGPDESGTPHSGLKPSSPGFARELSLSDVTYTYPGAKIPAIENVTITIKRNSFIALVGATGSGKTTLADIILGLLQPHTGCVTVDGSEIREDNVRAWQNMLGYVPQSIFLTDDTVAANIAFGVPKEDVDIEAVRRAAKIANIHDFIEEQLPSGYETFVGERGVRLSGGQRQRIGVARALYHDPQVLVLDEATSALDSATEAAVQEAIKKVAAAKTVIVIAHRLSTVRDCDRIFLLKQGRVAAMGSYSELLENNLEFRRIAQELKETANS